MSLSRAKPPINGECGKHLFADCTLSSLGLVVKGLESTTQYVEI